MMAGASATLGTQWGLIPRLGMKPKALILRNPGRGGRPCRSDRRSRPLRDHSLLCAGVTRVRVHPSGLHRWRVASSPARPARQCCGPDHRCERDRLGRRSGAWNGALSGSARTCRSRLRRSCSLRWRCGRDRGCRRSRPPAPCRPRHVSGAFRGARSRCRRGEPPRSSASSGCAHILPASRA